MLEYEIRSTRKSTSSSSSASCNKFDKNLANFKYDSDCFAKIGDDDILNTINAILILSNTEMLIKGLQDFALAIISCVSKNLTKAYLQSAL